MNISALLRELILHACKFKRLNKKALAERRIIEIIVDQLKAVDSIPLQLPHPTDSRAMRVVKAPVTDPGDQRDLKRLCKDCGASKRTIQRIFLEETKMNFEVAAAASAPSWIATAGLWRKVTGAASGRRLL
jgi:hypothetical protein